MAQAERATFAPKNDDGTCFYVVTKSSWGRSYSHLELATTLAEAKRQFGWTRELHVSVRVRRATVDDVAELAGTMRGIKGP